MKDNLNKPCYITFTGVDDKTDLVKLGSINNHFYGWVEWGVLHSEFQREQQNPWFPSLVKIDQIRYTGVRLSAHLCGAYARKVNNGDPCPVDLEGFKRAQINHREPNPENLALFHSRYDEIIPIAQYRETQVFPRAAEFGPVAWLYDPSGGHGKLPTAYPRPADSEPVGYAGGINPENVVEVVRRVPAKNYWLDMETGVRTDNQFDLDKCKEVLINVYGRM